MFHIREVLDDWIDMQRELAQIFNSTESEEYLKLLEHFLMSIFYSHKPHLEHHMTEFETLLDEVLPPDEDEFNEENNT
jgi:hypothetical protein